MSFARLSASLSVGRLQSGVDIATVRDVLGHSSIALTADVYAGIAPTLKDDAAERFERLLSRPS